MDPTKALKKKEIKKIREYLDEYKRPLFFYHDDPDGVCSYLQLMKYKGEGKGVILKNTPNVTEQYLRKVSEYSPDIIFVLDLAMVEQDFIDAVKVPVVWIDHHGPFERERVQYYNCKLNKISVPASYMCHLVAEKYLWIAVAGCVGDWYLPEDLLPAFREKFPDLIPEDVKLPQDALFASPYGDFVNMVSLMLKGTITQVNKNVHLLSRLQDPREVLNQSTKIGKYLYKQYKRMSRDYDRLVDIIVKQVDDNDNFLVFTYNENFMSFTKELSNYFLYKYPDKVIILGRETGGNMKLSLRSSNVPIPPILDEIFSQMEGRGGGHENACGAVVPVENFSAFVEMFREKVKQ